MRRTFLKGIAHALPCIGFFLMFLAFNVMVWSGGSTWESIFKRQKGLLWERGQSLVVSDTTWLCVAVAEFLLPIALVFIMIPGFYWIGRSWDDSRTAMPVWIGVAIAAISTLGMVGLVMADLLGR